MHLVKLPIGGSDVVDGVFQHTARMVGDALLYGVVRKATDPPYFGATTLPDAGDNAPPGVEVQWPVLAGLTSTGRMVVVFRSGEQGPAGWTGRSVLYAALGAASPLREPGQSVVVETTRPGPPGPRGARGEIGPQGQPGPPGAAGGDAEVDEATMQRIAALTAEKVWTLPPPDGYQNISGLNLGSLAQEFIAYLLTQRQDLYQLAAHRAGEAMANMVKDGNLPPVPE